MSGARTSSRHREQPSSARRHSRDEDYSRHTDDQPARSSTHRHRSSSARNSPHKRHDAASHETHRFRPEDYVLEGGVPPLRRQSTQPPHRRTSPTSHPSVAHREAEADVYRRREVEPTSARRRSTPHHRHSTPVRPAVSTALVVVEEAQVSPRRHSTRRAERDSPRRSARLSQRDSHHNSHIESEDGVVRSPRQHVSPSKTSPRRAHRQTGSPIRPERRAESSRHHRRPSAEPRVRSPHSSARRHREPQSARTPVPEANIRQDTLRYRSPPLVAESKRRSSSHLARRHSDAAEEEKSHTKRSASRRHDSARRSRSDRPPSRHDSERRQHREHRSSTPVPANDSGKDESRRVRHASRRRQESQDSSVAPREPPHVVSAAADGAAKGSVPLTGGSTYVRPNTNGHINTRRSSGSCIEVISVHSARPGSSSSWLHSRSSVPQSPRRPREVGPPIIVPDPRSEKLMQRIDSTRHWIKNMKEEVEMDRERELLAMRAAEAEERKEKEEEEKEAARQREAARVHKERQRGGEGNGSTHRHRSSSRGSQRRGHSATKESNGAASTLALAEPEKAVDSRRHPRGPIAPAAPKETSRVQPTGDGRKLRTHSTHAPSASTRTAASEKEESGRRSTTSAAAAAPAPAVMHDTVNSSRQDGFDYPIFSFVSFLDGNTFDSTAGMCQYNTLLAESLSDEHLDLLREVIFNHDEDAFAELLYGDDVQAEMDVVAGTLGHSEDPAVQREIVVLQRAAVRRFNEKCAAALRALLAAQGGLADAVQIAASQLERQAYEAKAAAANSP